MRWQGDLDSCLRVEEHREDDTLVVKPEVPGINPECDVAINLVGNQLQIGVQREEKSEHKGKQGCHSEFRYGTFARSVTLPTGVSQDDVQASYRDGVLEVRVPLPKEAVSGSRRIPMTRG